MNKELKMLTETAILIALAIVLDLIFKAIPFLNIGWPQGGSISLAMLPIILIGFRNGLKYGLIGSVAYAIINFMLDGFVLHIGSIFLDYLLAFGILGLSGLFYTKDLSLTKVLGVIVLLCFARYISHSLSGILFFREYASIPEGLNWNLKGFGLYFIYSFVIYNLPYMFFSTILCMLVAIVLYKRNLLQNKEIN